MSSWEIIVHGRVQGVGYRWHVLRCAEVHEVFGYVRNLSDGTVMIIAQAESERLNLFSQSICQGSTRAIITRVDITELSGSKSYNDFTIR